MWTYYTTRTSHQPIIDFESNVATPIQLSLSVIMDVYDNSCIAVEAFGSKSVIG